MNINLRSKRGLFFILYLSLAFSALNLSAQTNSYQSENSSIKVSGSSNLHDWVMKNDDPNASAVFTLKNGKLSDMNALTFSMKVQDLKSDENLLNSRAYKALDTETYSTINFKMSSSSINSISGGHYTIKVNGKLQIAGVTKNVVLYADAIQNSDKTISCTGAEKIKMRDYGVKPPSFMLGLLKVTDEVIIAYHFKFKN